jgi:outer membrane receptor protein involved in Fe transport
LGTTQSSGINTGLGWVASKNRITNNLHFNYNRSHSHLSNLFQDNENVAALAGINGVSQDPFNYGVPSLVFNNFQSVNDTGASLVNDQTFSWSDSVIWRHGKHNVRLGGDFRRIYNDIRSAQNARGSFTFTDSGTFPGSSSGFDFANFLLGLPAQTSIQGGSATYNFRQNSWDLFVQDDWRVTGSLSLNLGLRYEYVSPFSEANNRIVNLDLNSTITAAVPVFPGSAGPFTGAFPITVVEPDRNNFAPRVGFAWRPMKKTVVRGGYGINYNTGQYGSIVQNLAFQPPFAFTETNVSAASQVLTLENGFPAPTAAVTNNFAVDKNYKLGYVQIWNLNIQREITPSLLLNLGYNGSKGTDLDMERAPNRLPNGQLRIAGVQPFILETSQGDSILHAATVQVRKRMRHGMAAQGTYVFSKSIDNASSIGGGAVVVAQNDLDLAAERGLSSFDQRHKFIGNFTYELPFGTGKKWLNNNGGWLENVFGDWLWSGNVTLASGFPFTPRILGNPNDIAQGLNGVLRADIVGDPYSGTCPNGFPVGTIECWFNTSAFVKPVSGFGDARRNSIIGPGQFTFGMSVSKTLLAKDTRALELRISANNVFNHPEYTSIGTIVGTPTYGQVIAAGSMRTVNLSARYRF